MLDAALIGVFYSFLDFCDELLYPIAGVPVGFYLVGAHLAVNVVNLTICIEEIIEDLAEVLILIVAAGFLEFICVLVGY